MKTKLQDNSKFAENLGGLGLDVEIDALYLIESKTDNVQIKFQIEQAKRFNADAVFLRRQLGGYRAQAYIYDFTGGRTDLNPVEIQKRIWSSGEAPMACLFFDGDIDIINCSVPINKDNSPVYLVQNLQIAAQTHQLYNRQFALKVKSGIFWEEQEIKQQFSFKRSAYDTLINYIKNIKVDLKKQFNTVSETIINKIIIQSILIKYLEERVDSDGNGIFSDKYFKKYSNSKHFVDVLEKGKLVNLLNELNDSQKGFNGNVFYWKDEELEAIKNLDLKKLANALRADNTADGQGSFWRLYEFNYIPVELISRLYEEFLGVNKAENGMFYTPAHMAKLLVDECMPLHKFGQVDLANYKILDPACGSGIFLVIAYKRLVQWWRLQNDFATPELTILKSLLKNSVYGVDLNSEAVRLAAFSLCLALCDELSPKQIIEKLKFDDLTESNIIESNFFTCTKFPAKTFDLIIGNPPFVRGGLGTAPQKWIVDGKEVAIPVKQAALKFLSDSLIYLKEKGLQCLIIKSSSLLYNSSSKEYKEILFSKFNVIQVLDFTSLGRSNYLWDNGADVAAAAIFTRNEKPNFKNNVLHVTFRRTKATKERIVFEIDEYDMHYLSRQAAIENSFIWKANLLGGGRVRTILENFKAAKTLDRFLSQNDCVIMEGHGTLTKNVQTPTKLYKRLSSDNGIVANQIQTDKITDIKDEERLKITEKPIWHSPNIIFSETPNLDKGFNNFALNTNRNFIFKNRYVGIASKKGDISIIETISKKLIQNDELYLFWFLTTSAQLLVNLNTAIMAYDIKMLPFVDSSKYLTAFDKNVIADVNNHFQKFLRNGENSKAVQKISGRDYQKWMDKYGTEFSKAINTVYQKGKSAYRLSDVIRLYGGDFIAVVFKYDTKNEAVKYHDDNTQINLKGLSDREISKHLTFNRIIRFYPEKNMVVFVKPNQYRYWLSLIAYRDADKYFTELSKRAQ